MVRLLLPLALVIALVAGCGEDDGGTASDGPAVVATTPVAADLVRSVSGGRATALLAPNADPHEYEVRPRDVEAVAEADLIVRSGGDLDQWLQEAIDGSGTDAPVLDLMDHVDVHHAEEGHDHAGDDHEGEELDPHWWQDPRNAEKAVAAIRDALAKADPGRAGEYRANADDYLAELRRLDRAVARCIDRVPPEDRKLVTTHDALGYYAERYGIEVIGTVIPSLSTAAQPSAGETAELVDTIREAGVTTIFAESAVNPKVEDAIAQEAGATVGEELYADTLGPEGSAGATYLGAIAANTRAIVAGFGGRSCSLPS